jgi:hypothetical protein
VSEKRKKLDGLDYRSVVPPFTSLSISVYGVCSVSAVIASVA